MYTRYEVQVSWPRIVGLLVSALLLTLSIVVIFQVYWLVTPVRNTTIDLDHNLTYQEIMLTTQDEVSISGWYIPGNRPEALVLVHGVHANRSAMIAQAVILTEAGYHILMIDLRGHGASGDAYLTYGYNEAWDVKVAVDYLDALPSVNHIGVFGYSLGGAAVVRMAAQDDRVEALIVESSYASLSMAAIDGFDRFALLPSWPFAPLITTLAELITGVDIGAVDSVGDLAEMGPRPLLIIHGDADVLFPSHHAQMMYEHAPDPKQLWLVENTGHSGAITTYETLYRETILTFLDEAF